VVSKFVNRTDFERARSLLKHNLHNLRGVHVLKNMYRERKKYALSRAAPINQLGVARGRILKFVALSIASTKETDYQKELGEPSAYQRQLAHLGVYAFK